MMMMIPSIKPSYNKNHLKNVFSKYLKSEINDNVIKDFENKFANLVNSKYAITFPYARAGLFAFLQSQNIIKSNIILPAYQCLVVPNTILASNNTPLFVDNKKNDVNMDIAKIKNTIDEKTRAIIVTHMHGFSTDIKQIRDIVPDDVFIIEDSCLSLLSKYEKTPTGNLGDISFYSFNNTKQLTTNNGGMIVTNNEEIANKLLSTRTKLFKSQNDLKNINRFLKTYSSNQIYENKKLFDIVYYLWNNFNFVKKFTKPVDIDDVAQPSDFTSGFDPIRAYLGLTQIQNLPKMIEQRKKIGKRYYETLEKIQNLNFQPYDEGSTYGHFPVWSKDRLIIKNKLEKMGIMTGHSFDYSCPHTPAYAYLKNTNFPESKEISAGVFNLPMHHDLSEQNIEYICDCMEKIFTNT